MSKTQQSNFAQSNRAEKETQIDTGASEQFVDDRRRVSDQDTSPETEQATLFGVAGDDGDDSDDETAFNGSESEPETLGHFHKWGQSGLINPDYISGDIRITVDRDRRREDTSKVVFKNDETGAEYTAVGRIEHDKAESVAETLADGMPPGAVNLDPEENNEFKSRVSALVTEALEEANSGGLDNYC